jgi:hypothetical protein
MFLSEFIVICARGHVIELIVFSYNEVIVEP